jgi:hypothetical protein
VNFKKPLYTKYISVVISAQDDFQDTIDESIVESTDNIVDTRRAISVS